MIMIKSVSMKVPDAVKINELVESGKYSSFSAFIREAVKEKLNKE